MASRIPALKDAELKHLSKRIEPLVEKDNELRRIKKCDLKTIAFMWSPKFKGVADDVEPFRSIITYHTWAYYGFFKPTIYEVLAQIPDDCLGETVAFSVAGPEDVDDLNEQRDILNEGYHRAVTTLYRKKTVGAK